MISGSFFAEQYMTFGKQTREQSPLKVFGKSKRTVCRTLSLIFLCQPELLQSIVDQIVGLVAGRTQRQPVFKAAHAHYIKGGLEGDRVYFFEQTVDQRLYGHLLTARSFSITVKPHLYHGRKTGRDHIGNGRDTANPAK